MRCAIVTDTFPPEINGVAMTLQRLACGLAHRGHAVEIVRPNPDRRHSGQKRTDQPEVDEWRVRGIPLPGYSSLRLGLPQKRKLLQAWGGQSPDVIYVATEGLLGHSAVSAADALGVPAVSGYHTHFAQYLEHYHLPALERIALSYLRRLHNRTALTLAPTNAVVDELKGLGFERTYPLGRGVDTELFHPDKRCPALRARWGATEASPVALIVGRVAPEKNVQLALASVRQLRAAYPDLKAVVVGDGPARPALERSFPEAVWAGARRGEDLAAHYASADLFVFPSESETYGNVVLEAMASGLVVTSYKLAAAAELIRPPLNGYLADPGEPLLFRQAMRDALGHRSRWAAVRSAARETAAGNTWHRIIAQFEGYLRCAIDRSPPGAATEAAEAPLQPLAARTGIAPAVAGATPTP